MDIHPGFSTLPAPLPAIHHIGQDDDDEDVGDYLWSAPTDIVPTFDKASARAGSPSAEYSLNRRPLPRSLPQALPALPQPMSEFDTPDEPSSFDRADLRAGEFDTPDEPEAFDRGGRPGAIGQPLARGGIPPLRSLPAPPRAAPPVRRALPPPPGSSTLAVGGGEFDTPDEPDFDRASGRAGEFETPDDPVFDRCGGRAGMRAGGRAGQVAIPVSSRPSDRFSGRPMAIELSPPGASVAIDIPASPPMAPWSPRDQPLAPWSPNEAPPAVPWASDDEFATPEEHGPSQAIFMRAGEFDVPDEPELDRGLSAVRRRQDGGSFAPPTRMPPMPSASVLDFNPQHQGGPFASLGDAQPRGSPFAGLHSEANEVPTILAPPIVDDEPRWHDSDPQLALGASDMGFIEDLEAGHDDVPSEPSSAGFDRCGARAGQDSARTDVSHF